MRSRRALAALAVVAVGCMMLTGAPFAVRADKPPFVTNPAGIDADAGYHHDNERFTGFSLTHASVGCPAFGDIPMLPTTTPIGSQPWSAWEKIAHDKTEGGVPGYYTARVP